MLLMAEALLSGRLPAPNAAVARRRVATALRQLRAASGETQVQVAAAADGISERKLGRIEDQTISVNWTDVAALLTHYGVDETNRGPWIELAKQAWRPTLQRGDRWADYRSDIPRQHLRFYELIDAAAGIDSFSPRSIPPLLQTQSFARVLPN